MKKIGLVLSGGGIRGIAHLGLLKVLDEIGLKLSAISGVSAGAVIGALYASGKSPDEILDLGKKNINFRFSRILWRKGGLFSKEFLHNILIENIPHNSFEGLNIPLTINATDFYQNKTIYFSKGTLIPFVQASASVPIIFDPEIVEEKKLIDGGLLNNFPTEPLMSVCDKIIGSHVNKLQSYPDSNINFSRFSILERCYHMTISKTVYSKMQDCDLFIEPELFGYGMFDLRHFDQIFEIGYQTALNQKEKLLKLMD